MDITNSFTTINEALSFYEYTLNASDSDDALKILIQKTAALGSTSFFHLVKVRDSLRHDEKHNYKKLNFLASVAKTVRATIHSQPLAQTVSYEVRDRKYHPGRLIAVIIPTMHDTLIEDNAAINQNPYLHSLVQKCRILFSELGEETKKGLDFALLQTAKKAGISVKALESSAYQELLTEQVYQNHHSMTSALEMSDRSIEGADQRLLDCLRANHDLLRIAGCQAYHEWNLPNLTTIKSLDLEGDEEVERVRHIGWITPSQSNDTHLVDELEHNVQSEAEEKPVAIAVNAFSLIGCYGFLNFLRTFEIKQINHSLGS